MDDDFAQAVMRDLEFFKVPFSDLKFKYFHDTPQVSSILSGAKESDSSTVEHQP